MGIFHRIKFIILVVLLIFILNQFYALSWLNKPLNSMFAGKPDVTCNVDSDCISIQYTSCNYDTCTCGSSVNKDWKPYCPFKIGPSLRECGLKCFQRPVKCIDNECKFE